MKINLEQASALLAAYATLTRQLAEAQAELRTHKNRAETWQSAHRDAVARCEIVENKLAEAQAIAKAEGSNKPDMETS